MRRVDSFKRPHQSYPRGRTSVQVRAQYQDQNNGNLPDISFQFLSNDFINNNKKLNIRDEKQMGRLTYILHNLQNKYLDDPVAVMQIIDRISQDNQLKRKQGSQVLFDSSLTEQTLPLELFARIFNDLISQRNVHFGQLFKMYEASYSIYQEQSVEIIVKSLQMIDIEEYDRLCEDWFFMVLTDCSRGNFYMKIIKLIHQTVNLPENLQAQENHKNLRLLQDLLIKRFCTQLNHFDKDLIRVVLNSIDQDVRLVPVERTSKTQPLALKQEFEEIYIWPIVVKYFDRNGSLNYIPIEYFMSEPYPQNLIETILDII